MPKFDQYYIVEFRMPIKVESVSSVQEAVSRAKQMCENQFGFKPDNWNARVFEYSTGINITGHVKEYFYNPNSSHYREITKNMEYFNDLVKKGMTIEEFEKGIIRGDITNGEQRLRNIGLNNTGEFTGNQLARKAVLFGLDHHLNLTTSG